MPGCSTHQPFRLRLRVKPSTPFQRHSDYDLILNGSVVGEIYFNMTGYVGVLPEPGGPGISIGERGISAYRSEISRINRDARKGNRTHDQNKHEGSNRD